MKRRIQVLQTIQLLCAIMTLVNVTNGTSVVYTSGFGDNNIVINGKAVSLENSTEIERTNEYIKYMPDGMPDVTITKYTNGGISVVAGGNNSSVQVGNVNSEKVEEIVNQRIAEVQANLDRMREEINQQISSIFNNIGFPFN